MLSRGWAAPAAERQDGWFQLREGVYAALLPERTAKSTDRSSEPGERHAGIDRYPRIVTPVLTATLDTYGKDLNASKGWIGQNVGVSTS